MRTPNAQSDTNMFAENHDRISSLSYSWKHDRVLSSNPFRLNMGPVYDKYMEWGYIDGSVRFYSAESRKVGRRMCSSAT